MFNLFPYDELDPLRKGDIMKPLKLFSVLLASALLLTACIQPQTPTQPEIQVPTAPPYTNATQIILNDDGITVDGAAVSTDPAASVYTANDIVYYESEKDFTYGEGSEADAHTPQEAAAHTVVHITKPGVYSISGKLSLGQIAVDLGDDAKDDPNAVVTLVLNGMDITCQVAPGVIFYNVYECADAEQASKDVDTSAAGANVIIADGTVNTVRGAYVARIYKPDSVVLNEEKTEVEDAKKLHKYDGAFYSKQTMNLFGGAENTGVLNIHAENEGLDTELHLTINGGNIHIESGNDGINTNEDGISVTTINGGSLSINVTGETGEGDGIDSNGWLVINGGTVTAAACSNSADAGIDSDMGIHINGGTVIATGHMLDQIASAGQNYAVFNFAQKQTGSETVTMKDSAGNVILETAPNNGYSILIYSSPLLKSGTYTLFSNGTQLSGSAGGMMGGHGMRPDGMGRPDGMQPPAEGQQPPEGNVPPEDFTRPEGDIPPEDFTHPEGEPRPEDFTHPEGETRPEKPEGNRPGDPSMGSQEQTTDFTIRDGGNMFQVVSQ